MGQYHDELSRIAYIIPRTLRWISRCHRRSSQRFGQKNRQSSRRIRTKNQRTQRWSCQNQWINQQCQRRHCFHHWIIRKRFVRTKSQLGIRHRQPQRRNCRCPPTHRRCHRLEKPIKRRIRCCYLWTQRSFGRRSRSLGSFISIIRRSFFDLS